MSGLREAFDEIVADVPVYGDLDRAIEQAERDRLHRYGAAAGLAAAAAVIAVIVGVLAVTRDGNDTAPPISPSPTPLTPSPTPTKSQSPQTWVDTAVAATNGYGWDVPDPLAAARDAWFDIVAEHLDPKGDHLTPQEGGGFERPGDGSIYSTYGQVGLIVDRGVLNLFDDGCRYLGTPTPSDGTVSCSTERTAGPDGEPARISRYQRLCGSWDPGHEGDDARPGPGSTYATCGDYRVAVAVERRDGRIGYLVVDGRGTRDYNPFMPEAMAAVAADPRLTLPDAAYAVPSDQAVASVLEDHAPGYRPDEQVSPPRQHPGYGSAAGKLDRLGVGVSVWPAGGAPTCGRGWLIECVERRVYGADDPTTVFVGAWDEADWADCCPRNSRADSRVFVYVGPRHTVVVSEFQIVRADEEPISADLDQRLIDLALDPRLQ